MRGCLAFLAGFFWLFCLAPCALAHHLPGDPDVTDAQAPAIKAATVWLAEVDAGRFAASWRAAAAHLRHAVEERDWIVRLHARRDPLGAFAYRNVTRGRSLSLPDGDGVILEFDARFAKRRDIVETVTVVREADDIWRVASYYIR